VLYKEEHSASAVQIKQQSALYLSWSEMTWSPLMRFVSKMFHNQIVCGIFISQTIERFKTKDLIKIGTKPLIHILPGECFSVT